MLIDLTAVNQKLVDAPTKRLKFEAITFYPERNVRIDVDHSNLVPSIAAHGLEKPLVVSVRKSGVNAGLRGHLRIAAITEIKANNPKAFKKHFSKGIPCIVVPDLTEAEEDVLLVDHGSEKPLASKGELFLAIERFNQPEKATTLHVANLLDRVCPLSAKLKAELKAIRETGKAALNGVTDPVALAQITKDYEAKYQERYTNIRRGSVQKLRKILTLPKSVRSAFLRGYNGEKGLIINETQVMTLHKAYVKDTEDKNTPKPSMDMPGVNFLATYAKMEAEAIKAAEGTKEPTIRRRKSADVEGAINTSDSRIIQAAMQYTMGTDVPELKELEHLAVVAEVISKRDPKLWAEVEARYTEICQQQNEATIAGVAVAAK